MAQELNLKLRGLYTHPNELSEVPEGALVVADDVVIDEESIVAPRRGYERLFSLPAGGDRANALYDYKNTLLVHYGASSLGRYDEGGDTFTPYSGTFTPIDSVTRVRSAQANRNIYFSTLSGTKKIDAVAGTPRDAGTPKGLTLEGSLTGSSGFLSDDSAVAYRVVWGYEDANKNLVLGAPSERLVVTNTLGGAVTRDVALTITIPTEVDTSYFFQVYRSPTSSPATVDPGEELGLVYEAFPTSGEITAKSISLTDITPEGLIGATIYTAPSQEGIAQQNDQPPRGKDIAVFKGFTFFANTVSRHRATFTILAADGGGSPGSALQLDDVITIAGTDYTGKASTTVGSGFFKVSNTGSPAQNIDETARELVKVINQYSTNTLVNAFYLSGADDLPGKILIEERGFGGSSFDVTFTPQVANANPFSPTLPITSSNDEFKNGVYFSKLQQPEAVPTANVLFVGSAEDEILRIIPLRDSLFILKEDGIFRLTGETSANFRVDLFDNTAKLLAPNSAVTVNNQIMGFTDQGIAAITETGVTVVSRPIEKDLLQLLGLNRSGVTDLSFGVSYETDRKYVFFTVQTGADLFPSQAFVFNTFTNSWTRWKVAARCGLVDSFSDKINLGAPQTNLISRERKNFNFRDLADFGTIVEITNISGSTITLDTISNVERGDVLFQDSTTFAVIGSVDTSLKTVTLLNEADFTVGTDREVLKAIDTRVQWVPITGQNPGIQKHFREASLMFKQEISVEAELDFSTDIQSSFEGITLTSDTVTVSWGLFGWGNSPWGGTAIRKSLRTYVPLEKQRASQLNCRFQHAIGFSNFKLAGLSVIFEPMSERIVR